MAKRSTASTTCSRSVRPAIVSAFSSSTDALLAFRADPESYDVVITDQTMPEMTGVQLTQEIRKINTTVPVILCTGYSETVTEHSAHYYGVTEFLMKPVSIQDLSKTTKSDGQNPFAPFFG